MNRPQPDPLGDREILLLLIVALVCLVFAAQRGCEAREDRARATQSIPR